MLNWEIFLSSEQPDGFVVQAETVQEALVKTITHARKVHPGLFDRHGNLLEEGYPLVIEAGRWQ